jgi:serine protease
MKRVLLAAALLFAPFLHADDVQHRYIVATRVAAPVAVQRILTDDLSPRNDRDIEAWDIVDAFAANLTDAEVARLRASSHVAYVEPVVERHLMATRSRVTSNSDSIQTGREIIPYGVDMVNGPSVWPVSRGAGKNGTPTHVAIIDTGIDYNHPELKHAFKTGIDLVNHDNDPMDDDGHGTHVAGIIAAAMDSEGVVGVAPDVDIYSVKVLDSCGSSNSGILITAIQWVVNEKKTIGGNWVVNMSLGGENFDPVESAAFQAAADAGILVFASSGNSFDATTNPAFVVAYPAAYSSNVAVGAIDVTKTVASFSQRGPELKLVAPGVDVLSSLIASDLTTSDGKTFAAELGSASTTKGTDICLNGQHFSGSFVFCGFGGSASEFPAGVAGKIALISRGNSVSFVTKMTNARAAGATAAVVFNNVGDGLVAMDLGTATSASAVLPMLFIGQTDGQTLLATNPTISSGFGFETYANFDGTSMSCPHAAASAALAWSVAPTAARADVLNALLSTAHDLGDPGFDQTYGYGLVDAYAAALKLAPSLFPPASLTGRKVIRRGH